MNTQTTESIASAITAALPIAGKLDIHILEELNPSEIGSVLVYRSAGWAGSIEVGTVATATIPDMLSDDPASALKPAIESGFAVAGSNEPSTVENGAGPSLNGATYVVTVDEVPTLVIVVVEGEKLERASSAPKVSGEHLSNLHRISRVGMEVTVVIGKTVMTVQELLTLKPGQVVELDRPAGSPADILVNGKKFASGEVVVQDLDYGVKITSIHDDSAEANN